MLAAIRESARAVASLVYPPTCVVCSCAVERDAYLCDGCAAKAPRLKPPFCERCSEPFSGAITSIFTCANCANRTLHFSAAVAVYHSCGIVRKLLHAFKYGHERHLKYPLADWLLESLDDPRLRDRQFDMLVPVPLHSARERERGFNQALLLAEMVSKHTRIRIADTLERIRYTTTQTAYDRAERMQNLRDAFRLRKNTDVRGLRVLLIDDVLTTGSTLSECARVLRSAGATSVYATTAARA